MKEYTHIIVGLGVGLFMMSLFNMFMRIGALFYILGIFFFFFGFVNDKLDFLLSPDHNRIFLSHSPFSPILIFISFLFGFIYSQLNEIFGIFVMLAVHSIFVSHFFLDMLLPLLILNHLMTILNPVFIS